MASEEQAQKSVPTQYLSFWINNQLYGIPITEVVQIIGIQKIVPIPDYPSFVKGIINLRGVVIPIIEVRTRLHLLQAEYTERTCIIVTNIFGRQSGFIVDAVDEVTTLSADQIEAVPTLGNESGSHFVTGVGTLASGVIFLLSSLRLMSEIDPSRISA